LIVLDTNVLSALMRREADAVVWAWLDGLPAESVWTTSITVFEVRFGLEQMTSGRRRRSLEAEFRALLTDDLEGRVLPLDIGSADAAGALAADRRRAGRPIEIRDVLIAGIAIARKATLATRNTRHFQGIGLSLVDPWAN
jgi:predicted nucleic acid-binding protein